MRLRSAVWIATMLVLMVIGAAAQADQSAPIYLYSAPESIFGPEAGEFNKSIREVMFPWNDYGQPIDESPLQQNVQWLKDHPDVKVYVDGYASSRGELIYNLVLSQKRADYIKREMIALGIPENRILLAVGWGQLYPVCPELNDECWSKNRRVTLEYGPKSDASSASSVVPSGDSVRLTAAK
jgi:outer membrane protein OmpA-like peptidoglycan-associated protein